MSILRESQRATPTAILVESTATGTTPSRMHSRVTPALGGSYVTTTASVSGASATTEGSYVSLSAHAVVTDRGSYVSVAGTSQATVPASYTYMS
jgi:hypothetical protein